MNLSINSLIKKATNFINSENKVSKLKDYYRAKFKKQHQIKTLERLMPERLLADSYQDSPEFYKVKSLKLENLKISNSKSIKMYFYYSNILFYLFEEVFMRDSYKFKSKKRNPFIIDCGGNIGMTTMYFKYLYPQSEILVFEPSSINFELLEKNIAVNHLNHVTCIQKALYNKKDIVNLEASGTGFGSFIIGFNSYEKEKIETDLLSNYINKEVDLLKIDIEGSEGAVIEDLSINKKLKFIKQIVMEYHYSSEIFQSNNLAKILHLLISNNFHCEIKNSMELGVTIFLIHAYNNN